MKDLFSLQYGHVYKIYQVFFRSAVTFFLNPPLIPIDLRRKKSSKFVGLD